MEETGPHRGPVSDEKRVCCKMSRSHKFLVIPSKTATQRVAVLRENPSPYLENGLPRQSADWRAMAGFQQKVNFAAGPFWVGL